MRPQFLLSFFLLTVSLAVSGGTLIWENPPSLVRESLFYKSVPSGMVENAIEKRGLIDVPLDYDNPGGGHIKIFYRLLPCLTCDGPKDKKKPILVVINGGPGNASSGYRAYDFKYGSADPQPGRYRPRQQRRLGHHCPHSRQVHCALTNYGVRAV